MDNPDSLDADGCSGSLHYVDDHTSEPVIEDGMKTEEGEKLKKKKVKRKRSSINMIVCSTRILI